MTCIIGLMDNENIYMGGDSAASDGNAYRIQTNRKVFRNGPMLMGYSTSYRMGQLLEHSLAVPSRNVNESLEKYMVVDFVNSVRSCFKESGFAQEDDDGKEKGGFFLVGIEKSLFMIESNYQVSQNILPFMSIGSGSSHAEGAMMALTGTPEERIMEALKIASRFNCGVAAPFYVEKL